MRASSKRRAAMAGPIVVASLCGCASPMIDSQPATAPQGTSGIVYALPKAQVLLQASRRLVQVGEVDKAKKDADDASAALKLAEARKAETEAARKAVEAELKQIEAKPVGAEATADIKRRLDVARVVEAIAATQAATAKVKADAAAKAYATVHGHVGRWVETASLTVQPAVPDPRHRYVARHLASDWRDDSFSLALSNGLLSTGESKSTGQASAVILNLVKAAAGLQLGTSMPGSKAFSLSALEFSATPSVQCRGYDFGLTFDPTDVAEVERADALLQVESVGSLKLLSGDAMLSSGAVVVTDAKAASGLLYRMPRTVQVEVVRGDSDNSACPKPETPAAARLIATLPDAGATYTLPITASAFSKSSVKHVFKDGMLVEVGIERPSTLVSVASLPVDILKALISIPAELIKLRVDYSSQETAAVGQQVKLLEAQMDLIQAQKDLKAAQDAQQP